MANYRKNITCQYPLWSKDKYVCRITGQSGRKSDLKCDAETMQRCAKKACQAMYAYQIGGHWPPRDEPPDKTGNM